MGTGIPGTAYCSQCGEYVVAKLVQGSSDAVGGLIALGVGIAAAALVIGILGAIFDNR